MVALGSLKLVFDLGIARETTSDPFEDLFHVSLYPVKHHFLQLSTCDRAGLRNENRGCFEVKVSSNKMKEGFRGLITQMVNLRHSQI